MRSTLLHQAWTFRQIEEEPAIPRLHPTPMTWLPATVPGQVHLDLQANGVIADPFFRAQEASAEWVDRARWEYRTVFHWQPDPSLPKRVLQFEGLDTVCEIFLNGESLARHDNMFVPVELDVTERLMSGENELRIAFDSAYETGLERRREFFGREGLKWDTPCFDERAFVRKAPYMSGWDWGPRLISCGIWRPIRLVEFASRIRQASFLQEEQPDGRFRVWLEAEVEGEADLSASFAGEVRGPDEAKEWFVDLERWWPNGEGPQVLHPASTWLSTGHTIEKWIGLRTIRFVRESDEIGRAFEFEVNGRRLWIRGANWIPNDSFIPRDDIQAIYNQIDVCRRLNFNMLRVWGGGVYESEAFYDACDRYGILVWQDFVYACSYYPDDEPAQAVARREATSNVLRLRDRTSLALWCGNNENLAMYEQAWGGRENRPQRYYGEEIYRKVLPEVLKELDPQRGYIESSPEIVDLPDARADHHSDAHYWDVWHGRGDWIHYRDSETRFSSEFGFASSCSLDLWADTMVPGDWHHGSFVARWHDRTGKSREIFEGFVDLHYPVCESLEEWVYRSQLNQRDALRFGIEHYRRGEFCRGALIWQFNDCWPVQSWAVQDYRRRLKPAGFELRRLYAPILVSVDIRDGIARATVANDGATGLDDHLVLEALSTVDGTVRHSVRVAVVLAPGARREVVQMPVAAFDPAETLVRARLELLPETESWRFAAEPKEMRWGEPRLSVCSDNGELVVRVDGFVADLVLTVPGDPDALFDLATGETGWSPRTVSNESVRYGVRSTPAQVEARRLGGHASILPVGVSPTPSASSRSLP